MEVDFDGYQVRQAADEGERNLEVGRDALKCCNLKQRQCTYRCLAGSLSLQFEKGKKRLALPPQRQALPFQRLALPS